jgi:hypothetical protein
MITQTHKAILVSVPFILAFGVIGIHIIFHFRKTGKTCDGAVLVPCGRN